jgi:hypothetical protein
VYFSDFVDGGGATLTNEWYDNGSTYENSAVVTVTAGGSTVVNASLAVGIALTMEVYDTIHLGWTATASSGCVWAFTTAGDFAGKECVGDSTSASLALPAGTYKFLFSGFVGTLDGTAFPDQWWGGAYTFDEPQQSIDWPQTMGNGSSEAYLERAASISGTVTIPHGASMDGVVEVYEAYSGVFVGHAAVNSDGTYAVDGLLGRTFVRVVYADFTGAAQEWYSGAPTFNSASQVLLPQVGGNTTLNETLDVSGGVSGSLPLPPSFVGSNECVTAWYSDWYYVNRFCGSVGDSFVVGNLPAGSYYLEFSDDSGNLAYFQEVTNWNSALPVVVTAGSTTTLAQSSVTATPDASSVAVGDPAGVTVHAWGVMDGRKVSLQYFKDGVWKTLTSSITVTGGVGHFTWNPSETLNYRAVYGWGVSDSFIVTAVPPTVTGTADAASVPGGGAAGATVTVSPAPSSGSASLQYLNGSTWTPFATPVALVGGTAHFSWVPPQTFEYRAVYGTTVSAPFTITVVAPTVTGAADSASIGSGSAAGATVTVSPVPGSGTARLEYLSGSTWTPFATPATLVGGSAHFSWVPPQTFQYRAVFGTTYSAPFTITVTPPTVTGAADNASISAGGSAGATVAVSPAPGSGTASLQYLNGTTWTPFATPVTLVGGSAHFSWAPPQTFQYRAVFGTTYSAPFTITVTPPTVTGAADSGTIASGGSAGATVAVSPAPNSGTASLQYLNGTTWTPFATPVTLVGGSAYFSWVPPQTFQYRAVFGSTVSAPFTITVTVVAPTVVGAADAASIPAGGSAGATVTVGPTPGSGTASLQYLNGTTWTPFATPVTLVGGSAHFSWAPPQTFQYRAVFGTMVSAPFTITVTPPTVTGTADSVSIPAGGSAGATFTVSPDPGSGLVSLEFIKGSGWTQYAAPVALVGGTARFSWTPSQTFEYRACFAYLCGTPFMITVVPPTVTGTADSATIPGGGSAGATVTVSPVPGSGSASLQYLNGSTWTPFATPVTLVGGSAHFSWAPPQTFQYRAVFGTTYSTPFTITVTPPTVTGAADVASIPGGGSAGATVTVSPAPGSGTASLQYLNGTTWTPFATPVTLVGGSAHFSWAPPQTFQYRAVFGATVSAPFTITVTPPTVTGTADAASIASGGVAGATVAVSPNPGSGTARLEYLNGSTWTPFATPVTLVGGSAHFSWAPPQTFQYRAVFATTISPTFTITVASSP